ncbi:MAG TPA: SusC/RagA family TonB-linked outer membrane protein, partial [Chitinophagaceae bacterium]|nr:SusC/RagA family TonB-linked outer membrane protein [Chitinophagaceae bacterium]
ICCIFGFLLLLAASPARAQQKTITGTVRAAEGSTPIVKATVQVKGTTNGTTTGEDGTYRLTVTEGQTLSISAIGYVTTEQRVGSSAVINFFLAADNRELEGVIVTALGIKREERALGYSTTTVKGEQITSALSGNWTDALSGKVAGLNLIRSNGGPSGSNKIVLRGENNLTGDNEALIVVDGVVINQSSGRRNAIGGESVYGTGSDNMPADYGSGLNDINPEDIESVTVLKGPGAAALYGERGANGAIIITTKSGSSKRKGWGVTLNSNYGRETVNRWPDLQFEYGQGLDGNSYYSFGASADGASTSATSSAYGPRFNGQSFFQYDPGRQAQGLERTPWIAYPDKVNQYFEAGNTYTNSISIDGGTDKTTARFSFTNVNNNWITPNTGYKRNTIAMSVNSKVNDKLQIASKLNYTNKWSDNLPGAGYGNQSIMYWYIFWQPNADLDWLKEYWVRGQEQRRIFFPFSSFPENPYAIAYEFLNKSNRHMITGNVQATYNFTKDLSLLLRTSMDMSFEERSQQRPYDAGTRMPKGSFRTQNIFAQEVTSDFLLKYQKKVNSDFSFSATVGGSALRNRFIRDEVRADSLKIPGEYKMANAAGPLVTIPFKSRYGINSLYAMLTASYQDKYYIDITGRQDWTSTLATPDRTENTGFFYPSANVSAILSDIWELPENINYAKARFSVAGVGSGSTIPYRTAYYFDAAGSLYNGGLQTPTLLANPNLKPLRTISYEAGIDLKMFNNNLAVDIAVYSGNTKNQILERIIDRASGFTREVINLGKVRNQGLEVAVNFTPVKTQSGFRWNTGIVYSTNRNEILQLADSSVVLQTGPVGGGQLVAKTGGSMGDLYGRGYVRSPDGQIVYDATTGFARISEDVVYIGNTIPKGKVGFTNEFSYNQFRLNLLFDAQWGAVGHSLMHYKLAEQGKLTSTLPGRYNGITGNGVVQDATGKYVPNTTIATDIDEYYRSHWGIDNAEGSTYSTDFIKFREARLDYSFKPALLKKLGLQKAVIGVYGRNLFIWSPWPMFDPEFGTLSGSDIIRGFEVAQFPSTRTIGFNLVVGF